MATKEMWLIGEKFGEVASPPRAVQLALTYNQIHLELFWSGHAIIMMGLMSKLGFGITRGSTSTSSWMEVGELVNDNRLVKSVSHGGVKPSRFKGCATCV